MVVTPCVHGYNPATQLCNINTRQARIRYEPFPNLCPPCYREVEEEICYRQDEAILDRQADIQKLRDLLTRLERNIGASRRAVMVNDSQVLRVVVEDHEQMIDNTRRLIEQRKEEVDHNRRSRRTELEKFRQVQGVW